MPSSPLAGLPPALRALADTGAALARRAPSFRVAEARAAALLPGLGPTAAGFDPLDRRVVERVLRDAWQSAPAKVLDDWDPEPIAVRPAAQVHRGALDGRAVAVKVLRPGLASAVRADLALLEALGAPLGGAFPRLDVAGVLAEVREAALDELDLEHEGDTQRLVGRALRDRAGVDVPRVHAELTTENVLVTDMLEGRSLADGARPADPGATARALVGACLTAVERSGLALTDVRPGHVVVGGDRIGLLGAGVARPWSRERMQAAAAALAALRDPDGADDLAAVLETRLGMLPAESARAAHSVLREIAGDLLTGSARLDAAVLRQVGRRALALAPELAGLAARATPRPEDVSAFRAIGQLVATLAWLEATEDWAALVLDEVG